MGSTPGNTATRIFPNASEFERALVQAAAEGTLVLCATARLARRLLHRYRQARIAAGAGGWETPPIRWWHGWIRETYDELWLPRRRLAPELALKLWHQALQGTTVPDGLQVQPTLYPQLQASLDALFEAGLDVAGDSGLHRLADFRREVTGRFLELAEREGVALWRDTVTELGAAIAKGRVATPACTILAGFDNISPLEGALVDSLASRSHIALWRAEAEGLPAKCLRLYANPEQECRAVCAEVLQAWNDGAKNLAVVFCDRAYFPLLKRCFDDLAGLERPDFERTIRYNLTLGTPLIDHQLFQTAIIPLRLAEEPAPEPLLSSLLTSPYVRQLEPEAVNNLRATLWEAQRTLSLAEALKNLTSRGYNLAAFQRFFARQTAPLSDWLAGLNECLASLGFGRFEGQYRATDALAKQHLEKIIQELTLAAGEIVMNASGVLAWLTLCAEKTIVAEKTPETAGIQILSPGEACGLAFDQLWLVGCHGAVLPPPAREWPFLSPDEQRLLEGGTLEWRWEQGKRQLVTLLAAAEQVRLSRSAASDEETPYEPCPLLPDETGSGNEPIQRSYNLWKMPTAEWMRARWLREGCQALSENGAEDSGCPDEPKVTALPDKLSVTALENLAGCPFRFFCSYLLKLEPLVPAETGISPRERGKVLHAILKTFVDGLARHAPRWPADDQGARAWLEEAVRGELARCPDNIFWQVERLRLLGDAEQPGILPIWLAQECERAKSGWRFAMTEATFEGLAVAGLILHGRIDRIDHHPQDGWTVWDYKTGAVPAVGTVIEKVYEPQLPAYLLALERGHISNSKDAGKMVQAGYIGLKSAADVSVAPLTSWGKSINWPEVLPQWEQALAERLQAPRQGRFPADPRPRGSAIFHSRAGACEFCEYFDLCGFFDQHPSKDDDATNSEND